MEAIIVGDLTISLRQPQVVCGSNRLHVFKRTRNLLVVLSEHPNELVPVTHIMERLAPTTRISVNQTVSEARSALRTLDSGLSIKTQTSRKGRKKNDCGRGCTYWTLVVPQKLGRTIILNEEEQKALRHALNVCRRQWPGIAACLEHLVKQLPEEG